MTPHRTKINESYWWEILIDRNDPRVNVEFLMKNALPGQSQPGASPSGARLFGMVGLCHKHARWREAVCAPIEQGLRRHYKESLTFHLMPASASCGHSVA